MQCHRQNIRLRAGVTKGGIFLISDRSIQLVNVNHNDNQNKIINMQKFSGNKGGILQKGSMKCGACSHLH